MLIDTSNITLPPLVIEQPNVVDAEVGVRELRDKLLRENVDSFNPIRYATLTDTQKQELANYRQALLDITKDPAWPNITWPEKPSWI